MTNDTPVASPEPYGSPSPSGNTSSISLPLLPGESLVSSSHHGVNYESDDGEPLNITSELLLEAANEKNPWKNPNVRLSLALCITQGIADSIWGAVVLSGFLYALGVAMGKQSSDNTLVGAAEAVQGMAQLLFALPIGYVADVYGKARIVRYGGALTFVAVAITLFAITDAVHSQDSIPNAIHAYRWFLVALGLWGIVGGVVSGPSQALFADSIQKGKRSSMFTVLYSSYLIASTVGPIVSIFLFLKLSKKEAESWSMEEIYPVFAVGLCLEVPCAVLMFFFSDKYVVEEPDDESATEQQQQPSSNENDLEVPLLSVGQEESTANLTSTTRSLGKASIPYFLFVSSLVVSLGSGASVKYFPLFFKELGFGSAAVQGIFVMVPMSIAAFSFVAQRVSTRLGRIETTVLFDIAGTSLLFFMTWLSRDEAHLDMANEHLIVVVYILRTGIMNSSYPLLQSILMDNVPSNKRARWKSLESVAAFGWTGSALVGGILADDHSYRFTFAITASLQLFGALLLVPIRPFVESEVNSSDKDDGEVLREEYEAPTIGLEASDETD
jgi:MFS family permease